MTTFASNRHESVSHGLPVAWRGVAVVAGMALLLAGCGQGHNGTASSAATSAKPAASSSAPATSAGPAALPTPSPAAAEAAQKAAAAAKAKLDSMSVPDLLAAAREAYAQHRLVAPAGDNAMEYYEAVLAKEPNNQVAKDALRETFPFAVPDAEKAISQNNFDEADREIAVLAKADPTNYTLTLLRSKLDAQKKLQARQQQEAQQKAQKLAAEQTARQQQAAAKAEAAKVAAAQQAAQQAAAARAAPPKPVAPPPPPKPVGITRDVQVVKMASPEYPVEAARNRTSGYAVVEFTVTAQGAVTNVHVVSSAPRHVFDHAAAQAIERSQFKPAMKNGEPVSTVLQRRIDFNMGG